jgi:hypothetical protein
MEHRSNIGELGHQNNVRISSRPGRRRASRVRDPVVQPVTGIGPVARTKLRARVLVVQLVAALWTRLSGTGKPWSNDTSRRPMFNTVNSRSARHTVWVW